MENFIIRRMEKSDRESVFEVEKECFIDYWSLKSFEDIFLQDINYYFVAVLNQKIVGFIGCIDICGEVDITNVAVLKEYRGKNIGTALLAKLLEFLKEKNAKKIFLEVRITNISAINLYKKFGFEEYNIRKGYYNKPKEDALLMYKIV